MADFGHVGSSLRIGREIKLKFNVVDFVVGNTLTRRSEEVAQKGVIQDVGGTGMLWNIRQAEVDKEDG